MDIINFYSLETDEEMSESALSEIQHSEINITSKITLLKTICTSQITHIRLQNKEVLIDLFSKNLRKFLTREQVEDILNETKITDPDIIVYSKFRDKIKSIQNNTTTSSSSLTRSPVSVYKRKWIPRKGRESRECARQQDIFRFYDGKPKKYLDLGGGDGKISAAIGNYLRLSKDNVVCADIYSWHDSDTRTEKEDITYIKLSEEGKLPFKDKEFSFITCFQSLHHMRNVGIVVSELYRILEPGGYIVIREHDCDSVFMKMLIDIEHCIFETVLKDISDDFVSNYYGDYRSKMEWSNLFSKNNLDFCYRRYNFKTTRNNATRHYYSMYYKD